MSVRLKLVCNIATLKCKKIIDSRSEHVVVRCVGASISLITLIVSVYVLVMQMLIVMIMIHVCSFYLQHFLHSGNLIRSHHWSDWNMSGQSFLADSLTMCWRVVLFFKMLALFQHVVKPLSPLRQVHELLIRLLEYLVLIFDFLVSNVNLIVDVFCSNTEAAI